MIVGQNGVNLCIGDKTRFKNQNMIHPEAVYEGVVMEVHPTYYRVFGTPIRDTMNEKDKSFWGPAIPYYYCIYKYLNEYERIKVVDRFTETNEMLLRQYIPEMFTEIEQMSA